MEIKAGRKRLDRGSSAHFVAHGQNLEPISGGDRIGHLASKYFRRLGNDVIMLRAVVTTWLSFWNRCWLTFESWKARLLIRRDYRRPSPKRRQ